MLFELRGCPAHLALKLEQLAYGDQVVVRLDRGAVIICNYFLNTDTSSQLTLNLVIHPFSLGNTRLAQTLWAHHE